MLLKIHASFRIQDASSQLVRVQGLGSKGLGLEI